MCQVGLKYLQNDALGKVLTARNGLNIWYIEEKLRNSEMGLTGQEETERFLSGAQY